MMTPSIARTGLLSTVILALAAAGCGITVLVHDDVDGVGGTGVGGWGAGSTSTVTDTTTTSSGGLGGIGGSGSSGSPFPGCAVSCNVPSNGVDTCACDLVCGGEVSDKASCAPTIDLQGNHKVQCTCTVGDEFTGVCYEKHPQNLCTFDLGCCGKYLGK